jgi:hypothetical protein
MVFCTEITDAMLITGGGGPNLSLKETAEKAHTYILLTSLT